MTAPFAPTLVHAIGDPENRKHRVRFIGPTNLVVYKFVACEHPQELLDVITGPYLRDGGANLWLDADDGSVFRLGCMYGAEIAEDIACERRRPDRRGNAPSQGDDLSAPSSPC